MSYFSIIIPTYNRAHILPRTITSVLNQTFADWECIIVDDGSTDNTKELIASLTDPRIKYIYQDNAERSAARNNGIRNAKGTYICFLDSDDEYLPRHLEVLHREIESINSPINGMYIVHALYNVQGTIEQPVYPKLRNNKALEYVFSEPITPTRLCIHKEILIHIQFDEDICIVEDLVLWCKIAAEWPTFQITEYTVQYHLHEDNSVNLKNNSYTKRLEGLYTFFKRYPKVKQKLSCSLRKTIVSNTLFNIAKFYIYNGYKATAIKYTIQAICKKIAHPMTNHRLLVLFALLGLYSKKILQEYVK